MNRILQGKATRGDAEDAGVNFRQWIAGEWAGSEHLAIAYCLNELAAASAEWATLTEDEASAHVWLFSFLCPTRASLSSEAGSYIDFVRRSGGFQRVALRVRALRGD